MYFKKFDNSQISKYNDKSQSARITEASKIRLFLLADRLKFTEIYGDVQQLLQANFKTKRYELKEQNDD